MDTPDSNLNQEFESPIIIDITELNIEIIDYLDKFDQQSIELLKDIKKRELSGDQRTQQWLQQRHQFITGSAVKKCCSTEGSLTQLDSLIEKIEQPVKSSFKGNIYTVEGNILEPVSRDLYLARLANININYTWQEFGLVKHPTVNWAAASTDGVVYFRDTKELINVEIKSLRSKKSIRSADKLDKGYYCQMQWQMFCLGLDETDFIQTYIKLTDTWVEPDKDNLYMGQILEVAEPITGENIYIYSKVTAINSIAGKLELLELNKWAEREIESTNYIYIRTLYWIESAYSQIRVKRDHKHIDKLVKIGQKFWAKVKKARTDKDEHNKILKQRKSKTNTKPKTNSGKLPLLISPDQNKRTNTKSKSKSKSNKSNNITPLLLDSDSN